jgi:alpha-N-arabinofuranosidase
MRESLELEVALRDLERLAVREHTVLTGPDPGAMNTKEQPEQVRPRALEGARVERARLRVTLPPLSWNLVRLVQGPR